MIAEKFSFFIGELINLNVQRAMALAKLIYCFERFYLILVFLILVFFKLQCKQINTFTLMFNGCLYCYVGW